MSRSGRSRWAASPAVLAVVLLLFGAPPAQARPVPQGGPPGTGPGSPTGYGHDTEPEVFGVPGVPGGYVLYEPRRPRPAKAPVVVYLHGAQPIDQRIDVDAQLRHYAMKGYVVLYAEEGTALTKEYELFGRRAIADGLDRLQRKGHVHPDGHLAFIGFSLGGTVAMRIANTPDKLPKVPRPQVVILHDAAGEASPLANPTLRDVQLSGLADAHLLLIQAQESVGHPNSAVPAAWENSRRYVPKQARNWLVVPGDDYGSPDLVSDHPGSTGRQGGRRLPTGVNMGGPPLDMIDWWGYWRPSEDALAQVFGRPLPGRYDVFCSARLPKHDAKDPCASVRRMGRWNDGHPVALIRNAGDLGRTG